MLKKAKVAVVFGGASQEHDVSLMSARTVLNGLNRDKYEVTEVFIDKNGIWKVKNENGVFEREIVISLGEDKGFFVRDENITLAKLDIDIFFPVLHGPFGEDGKIQGLFEMVGVPYVGCGLLSSALAMDKDYCKQICSFNGIPVVPWITLAKYQDFSVNEILQQINLPCFVKPANMGSSVGISKVKKSEDLKEAIENAFLYDNKILIENGLEVKELECAVAGANEKEVVVSILGEIIPGAEFYDLNDKYYDGKSETVIPANISEELQNKMQIMAQRIYKILGCRGLARIDFFLDKNTNEIYFNEINTLPGFTEHSMYPLLMAAEGLELSPLLDKMISLSEH